MSRVEPVVLDSDIDTLHRPTVAWFAALGCHKLTSRNYKNTGTVTRHDPSKNKTQNVNKIVKAVLEANLEEKLTEFYTSVSILNTGIVYCLTRDLVRGDAAINNCTGTLIRPKLIRLNYCISYAQAGAFTNVRVMLFRWKDATTPTPAGILNYPATYAAPFSQTYWVNRSKIKVLYNKLHTLHDFGSSISAEGQLVDVNPGRAPIGLPLSGAGAIPQADGIFLLLISDDPVGTAPIADFAVRLVYTDA